MDYGACVPMDWRANADWHVMWEYPGTGDPRYKYQPVKPHMFVVCTRGEARRCMPGQVIPPPALSAAPGLKLGSISDSAQARESGGLALCRSTAVVYENSGDLADSRRVA